MKKFVYALPHSDKPSYYIDDGYLHDISTDHILYYIAQDRTIRSYPGGEICFWIFDNFIFAEADASTTPTYFFSD